MLWASVDGKGTRTPASGKPGSLCSQGPTDAAWQLGQGRQRSPCSPLLPDAEGSCPVPCATVVCAGMELD